MVWFRNVSIIMRSDHRNMIKNSIRHWVMWRLPEKKINTKTSKTEGRSRFACMKLNGHFFSIAKQLKYVHEFHTCDKITRNFVTGMWSSWHIFWSECSYSERVGLLRYWSNAIKKEISDKKWQNFPYRSNELLIK